MNIICTVYSNKIDLEAISSIIKKHIPKVQISIRAEDNVQIIEVEYKKGIFSSTNKIKITHQQRNEPNKELNKSSNCTLSNNIKGLHGFVNNIHAKDLKSKELFLLKIQTLNCVFSIIPVQGSFPNMTEIVKDLALYFDAILFVQPDSIMSQSSVGQHFLNKDLQLVLNQLGESNVSDFGSEIEKKYLEKENQYLNYVNQIPTEQRIRKLANEERIKTEGIKVNKFLPAIEREENIKLRTDDEVVERVTILAIINMFTSNNISVNQTIDILKTNDLYNRITPKEKDLLENPTEEKKSNETWKCEGIWTLLWALNIHDNLGNTSELCDLGKIPAENYPIHNPKGFIEKEYKLRSKNEIINYADLYYRYGWASVDLRINGRQSPVLNQGLVYERQYALNWLINYMGQEWDNISCDT